MNKNLPPVTNQDLIDVLQTIEDSPPVGDIYYFVFLNGKCKLKKI